MTSTTTSTTSTARSYVSDLESYQIFVGSITPNEFVKGFKSAEEAVKDFLDNFPYDEEIPAWLESSLLRYVESQLEEI